MPTFFEKTLARLAKKHLAEHKPHVIAVTGSVGKTSTRNAIAHALSSRSRVRIPYKNYNNELGVPLAILGEKSPGKNAWEWLKLFWRNMGYEDMPDYLVLEYGADKPGDIAHLVDIARPEVAVITAVSPVHLANYPSYEALVQEKASLGEAVDAQGLVVLNVDNEDVRSMASRFVARVVTYAIHHPADVMAEDIACYTRKDGDGLFMPTETFARLTATISCEGERVSLTLDNCISETVISTVLAGVAVAKHYGVSLEEAVREMEKRINPEAGRLRPLAGIRGSLILDDTYNAAPASMRAGLDALSAFTPGETRDRYIACLGDMAELGPRSEEEHRALGSRIAEVAQMFIAVGPQMRLAADAAIAAGMPRDAVEWFKDSREAGRYLDSHVQGGDVVLVKGSQSMRMERVVKDIMAEPLRAEELLVRQDAAWQE